jgi:hypothetical protein
MRSRGDHRRRDVTSLEPVAIPGHGKIAIYLYGGIEQGLWQLP